MFCLSVLQAERYSKVGLITLIVNIVVSCMHLNNNSLHLRTPFNITKHAKALGRDIIKLNFTLNYINCLPEKCLFKTCDAISQA